MADAVRFYRSTRGLFGAASTHGNLKRMEDQGRRGRVTVSLFSFPQVINVMVVIRNRFHGSLAPLDWLGEGVKTKIPVTIPLFVIPCSNGPTR